MIGLKSTKQIEKAIHERDNVLIKVFGLDWFCKQRKIKPGQLKLL